MDRKINIEKWVGTSQMFKLFFWGYTCLYLLFAILMFILCLVNVAPINFNGIDYYGVGPAFASLLYMPMVGFVMGGSNWLFLVMGHWIYRQFRSLFYWAMNKKKSK